MHHQQEMLDKYIKYLKELKIEWVRLTLDFNDQPNLQSITYLIKECQKNDIKVVGLLSNIIAGNIVNIIFPRLKNKPVIEQADEYRSFVIKYVSGLKKYIKHWQILNEVNTRRFWVKRPNPAEYVMILKETSDIIKKIDSKAKIIFSGILENDDRRFRPFIMKDYYINSLLHNAILYFDIASFHPYVKECFISLQNKHYYYSKVTKLIDKAKNQMTDSKKPIWITEFGISHKWVRISKKDIAWVYWMIYKYCCDNGIMFFLWQLFDIRQPGHEPLSPEKYFGLLDTNLKPKETYHEFLKLIRG